ncbi:transposase [Patescibacteria group bacterium]
MIMTDIYHVITRGVDKRKIFLDNQDRFRFIHDLFEFNDQELAKTTFYAFSKIKKQVVKIEQKEEKKKPRKLLVNLLAFCIMDNHYHLLLVPLVEKGVSKFMKKLNMGYSRYFNTRHQRQGTLFEGRFKRILVKNQSQFIHLPYYIHLNPLDFKFYTWRERKIKNYRDAMKFLENYRWSSHLDYMGIKNLPSITQRGFLEDFFDGPKGYKQKIKEWLKDMDLETIKDLTLE